MTKTINLPMQNGPILADTFGRVTLGNLHAAFPMEKDPFYIFRDVEKDANHVFRTNGRKMLSDIAELDGPVQIETGYTLLAALLICEDGFTVADLLPERMQYDRHTDTITWHVTRDRFGIPIGSHVVFGDAYQGKLTFSNIEPSTATSHAIDPAQAAFTAPAPGAPRFDAQPQDWTRRDGESPWGGGM